MHADHFSNDCAYGSIVFIIFKCHKNVIVFFVYMLRLLLRATWLNRTYIFISEPIFYGDLVYKFKRIVGKPNFSDQFKKIVKRYIRV